MRTESRADRRAASPFRIEAGGGPAAFFRGACWRLLETISGLSFLDRVYRSQHWSRTPRAFCEQVLNLFAIRYEVRPEEIDHVPRTGPAIVIANHPFGGLDGIIAAHLLSGVRSDIRIIVNYHLCRLPELREWFIAVDPYGGRQASQANRRPLREALRWVRGGGLLLIFPAGEVAHFSFRRRGVQEAEWNTSVGRLVRMTRAPVVPLYFYGRNSLLFQIAGAIHPLLRTLLLPREFVNKRGRQVKLRIGRAIRYGRIQRLQGDDRITRYLRLHNRLLGKGPSLPARDRRDREGGETILPATPVDLLRAEIANLAPEQRLLEHEESEVYVARPAQIPWTLQEIGRLREMTFREVGEGTGRCIDLDQYDASYLHLFIWQRQRCEIVGAYRLAPVDEVIRRQGLQGLYTHSLFRYGLRLIDRIQPSVELGRSFIRPEYQRKPLSLMLLWRGIGAWLVRNPRYRYLFGPVTISGDYDQQSTRLMIDCLRLHNGCRDLPVRVRPRKPVPGCRPRLLPDEDLRCVSDIELVSDLIEQIEADARGVPVLIRQYLKLGGRFLEFNVDESFNNAVDGLIVIDMARADRRLLQYYMGRAGAERYLNHPGHYHGHYDKAS